MEIYSAEIIDNIKHEPEEYFVLDLPDIQESSSEPDETPIQANLLSGSGIQIKVRRFNENWKRNLELFQKFIVCENCDFVTRRIADLKEHFKRCKGTENKCPFCDQKFTQNARDTHELREHRKESTWQCSQCPYNTLVRNSLLQHSRRHFKKFSCESCTKKFTHPFLLKDHQIQNKHGVYVSKEVERFDCHECRKSFATKMNLHHHTLHLHKNRKLLCDLCGRIFKRKQHMRRHMNIREHLNTLVKVPCSVCLKLIAENLMEKHMKANHSSGNTFLACTISLCRQKFSSVEQLNEHQSIHIGNQRFKCPTCYYEAKCLYHIKKLMKNH